MRPPQPRGSVFRSVMSVSWSLSIILFLVLVAVNLAALAYASTLVVDGAMAGGPRYIDLYVLAPYPVGERFDAEASTFLLYFSLVVGAIVAAYVWHGVRDAKATGKAFARPLDQLRARLESRSAWVATGQVFLAATFFQFAFILLVLAAGGDASAPDSGGAVPSWYPYYALANASVYEEFVTRWMFIGVPLAVSAGILRGGIVRAGGTPAPAWRHLLGGSLNRDSPRSLVAVAIALALLSSVIFGLAHVPSWGWWKFAPAAVAGFGLAYLFLRHGFLAGILFHFSTNYLGAVALLTEDSLGAQMLLGLLILFIIGFGAVFFAWYLKYGAELTRHVAVSWGLAEPRPTPVPAAPAPLGLRLPPPPPPPPVMYGFPPPAQGPSQAPSRAPLLATPPYGTGFLDYRCGRCGWSEARYAEGRLTCLRCGHAS